MTKQYNEIKKIQEALLALTKQVEQLIESELEHLVDREENKKKIEKNFLIKEMHEFKEYYTEELPSISDLEDYSAEDIANNIYVDGLVATIKLLEFMKEILPEKKKLQKELEQLKGLKAALINKIRFLLPDALALYAHLTDFINIFDPYDRILYALGSKELESASHVFYKNSTGENKEVISIKTILKLAYMLHYLKLKDMPDDSKVADKVEDIEMAIHLSTEPFEEIEDFKKRWRKLDG